MNKLNLQAMKATVNNKGGIDLDLHLVGTVSYNYYSNNIIDTNKILEILAESNEEKDINTCPADCACACCDDCKEQAPAIPFPLYGGAYFDEYNNLVYIKQVIFNKPATIVFWSDGDKTTSVCDEKDPYSKECGLAIAVLKKFVSSTFVAKLMEDWVVEGKGFKKVTLGDVRKAHRKNK